MIFAFTASSGFAFTAINAAYVPGYAISIITQVTVFANHIDAMLNDMMHELDMISDI